MKHLWIREETRCTASVPEDDSYVREAEWKNSGT